MDEFFNVISLNDVLLCMIAAFFLAHLIRIVNVILRLMKDETVFEKNPSELSSTLEKCYSLFPKDIFDFNGMTFRRGLYVRLKTVTSKIIEGKIIGLNERDEICVITRTYISAEKLNDIAEITVLDSDSRR